MAIRCGNCRGFYSSDEITRRKPPLHPWPITPAGEKAIDDNVRRGGEHWPCPACGHRALIV